MSFNIKYKNILSAIIVGVFNTALLHPIDRGLFLLSTGKLTFTNLIINKKSLYHGLCQSIFFEAICIGSYYYFQNIFSFIKTNMEVKNYSNTMINCFYGSLIGTCTAPINHLSSAIKYRVFARNSNPREVISHVLKNKNIKILNRGFSLTLIRDLIFGTVYELTRSYLNNNKLNNNMYQYNVFNNFMASFLGWFLAYPFHYTRHHIFSSNGDISIKSIYCFTKNNLKNKIKIHSEKTNLPLQLIALNVMFRESMIIESIMHISISMSIGQILFDSIMKLDYDIHPIIT